MSIPKDSEVLALPIRLLIVVDPDTETSIARSWIGTDGGVAWDPSLGAKFHQFTKTMAQSGHLEYMRASRHAPPPQVGEESD